MFEPAYSLFDMLFVLWAVSSATLGTEAVREKNRSFAAWYIIGFVSSPLLGWLLLRRLTKKPDPPKRLRFFEITAILAFIALVAAFTVLLPIG